MLRVGVSFAGPKIACQHSHWLSIGRIERLHRQDLA